MERFVLTDEQWAQMEPHCLGKATDPGRSGGNNRLFMEAVLWIARTGSPGRDLPAIFGNWSTAVLSSPMELLARADTALKKLQNEPGSPARPTAAPGMLPAELVGLRGPVPY